VVGDAFARGRRWPASGVSGRMLFPAVVLEADQDSVLVDAGSVGEHRLSGDARLGETGPDTGIRLARRGDVVRIQPTTQGGWRLSQTPEVTGRGRSHRRRRTERSWRWPVASTSSRTGSTGRCRPSGSPDPRSSH
jgi:hypothetical protein